MLCGVAFALSKCGEDVSGPDELELVPGASMGDGAGGRATVSTPGRRASAGDIVLRVADERGVTLKCPLKVIAVSHIDGAILEFTSKPGVVNQPFKYGVRFSAILIGGNYERLFVPVAGIGKKNVVMRDGGALRAVVKQSTPETASAVKHVAVFPSPRLDKMMHGWRRDPLIVSDSWVKYLSNSIRQAVRGGHKLDVSSIVDGYCRRRSISDSRWLPYIDGKYFFRDSGRRGQALWRGLPLLKVRWGLGKPLADVQMQPPLNRDRYTSKLELWPLATSGDLEVRPGEETVVSISISDANRIRVFGVPVEQGSTFIVLPTLHFGMRKVSGSTHMARWRATSYCEDPSVRPFEFRNCAKGDLKFICVVKVGARYSPYSVDIDYAGGSRDVYLPGPGGAGDVALGLDVSSAGGQRLELPIGIFLGDGSSMQFDVMLNNKVDTYIAGVLGRHAIVSFHDHKTAWRNAGYRSPRPSFTFRALPARNRFVAEKLVKSSAPGRVTILPPASVDRVSLECFGAGAGYMKMHVKCQGAVVDVDIPDGNRFHSIFVCGRDSSGVAYVGIKRGVHGQIRLRRGIKVRLSSSKFRGRGGSLMPVDFVSRGRPSMTPWISQAKAGVMAFDNVARNATYDIRYLGRSVGTLVAGESDVDIRL